MGEYYSWVNVDRKEYIDPLDFDCGCKSYESCHQEGEVLKALRDLLAREWKGCRIFWMGDECGLPENISNDLFAKIKTHYDEMGCDGYMYDMVLQSYTNVSGLYKAAEKVVREEIGFFLEDIALGEKGKVNTYGVNLENAFDGLFRRDGINSKYIINYTKGICYSFGKTKFLYQDGRESDCEDPLPLLLGYGRSMEPGEWLGDIIGVGDEIEDGITVIDSITLDW